MANSNFVMGSAMPSVSSDAIDEFNSGVSKAAASINRWENAIKQFDSGAEKLLATVRNIARAMLDGLSTAITKATVMAANFVANIGRKMVDAVNAVKSFVIGAKAEFLLFKNTVTEGKKGLAGFAAAIKNIGKISVVGVYNGIKKIASTKLTGLVTSVKDFVKNAGGVKGILSSLRGGLMKVASTSFNALHQGLSKIGSFASQGATKLGSALGGALKGLSKAFIALAPLAAKGLSKLTQTGMGFNASMEQYDNSFKHLLGGAEQGTEMVANLKKMAAQTPLSMPDLAEGSKTLLEFGVSQEKILPSLKMLGDASLGNSEHFSSMTSAFAQIQSAGKLTETHFQSLMKAGFNPLESMSQATGKSIETLKQEMASGAISADMVTDALVMATSEGGKFYNAMEETSKTFDGQMSNLKESSTMLFGDITKGLFYVARDTALPMVADKVSQLQSAFDSGGITGFLSSVGGVLGSTMTDIAAYAPMAADMAVSLVSNFLSGIESSLPQITQGAATAISCFADAAIKMLPGLLVLGGELILGFAEGLLGQLPTLLTSLSTGINTILSAIQYMLPQFMDIGVSAISMIAKAIMDNLPIMLNACVGIIQAFIDGIIANLNLIISSALDILTALAEGIVTFLPVLIESVFTLLQAISNFILDNIQLIVNAALKIVTVLADGLIQNLPLLMNSAIELVSGFANGILKNLDLIVDGAGELIKTLVTSIFNNLPGIIGAAVNMVAALAFGFLKAAPKLLWAGFKLIGSLIGAVFSIDWLDVGRKVISSIGDGIAKGFKNIFGNEDVKLDGKFIGGSKGSNGTKEKPGFLNSTGYFDMGENAPLSSMSEITAGALPDDSLSGNSMFDFSPANFDMGENASLSLMPDITAGNVPDDALSGNSMFDFSSNMDLGAQSMSEFSAGISSGAGLVTGTAYGVTSDVAEAFQEIDLKPSGADAMKGFIEGIKSMRSSLMDTVNDITGGAFKNLGGSFTRGIESAVAVKTAGSLNVGGSRATGNTGGPSLSVGNIVLQNVGDRNPKQLANEILEIMYEKLSGANEVMRAGNAGGLL